LSKLYARYSLGLIGKKELESRIFKFILDSRHEFRPYKWSDEEFVDFVCALYPRIRGAIDNYRETGSSFEAYITALVRWGIKESRSRKVDRHIVEYACWEAKAWDEAAVQEEEDLYIEPEPVFGEVVNPRQVLVLLLKSYNYMSQDFLKRASPALNMDQKQLGDLVDRLRELRLKRDEDIRALRERIYTQFYRCIVLEKKLRNIVSDSGRYEKLQNRLVRGRLRLQSMRKRLSRMKTTASNREVAQILESSKGTIDAHLFDARDKWGEQAGEGEGEEGGKYRSGGPNA
jgi:DNA-directed RNA polymerase specialized sigma24 family protein